MKKKIIMVLYSAIFLFPITVFAEETTAVCPLGPDVTKDLYGVLMILKIVAPLLCIGLSVFEAIKAVAKGDPSTDLKVVAKKFLKRMLYALILFFIPVIVDIFFQMADVWGANGTCDLMNPENNGTEKKTCYVCVSTGKYYTINNQGDYDTLVNNGTCQGWALQPQDDTSNCSQ